MQEWQYVPCLQLKYAIRRHLPGVCSKQKEGRVTILLDIFIEKSVAHE